MRIFSDTVTLTNANTNYALTALMNAVDTAFARGMQMLEYVITPDDGNDGANPVLHGRSTGSGLSATNYGGQLKVGDVMTFAARRSDDLTETGQLVFRSAAAGQKLHVFARGFYS